MQILYISALSSSYCYLFSVTMRIKSRKPLIRIEYLTMKKTTQIKPHKQWRSQPSTAETHKRYLFGSGIILEKEFVFFDDVKIRPIKLSADIEVLKNYVTKQIDYGFLCALSETLTFELEMSDTTDELVARKAWNCQWLLVLLSAVLRSPVNWSFESVSSCNNLTEQCCWIKYPHIASCDFNYKKKCRENDLVKTKELSHSFMELLKNSAFSDAAAIAANTFREPRKTIRMAAIWSAIESLIGISQELNYRIPLLCSLILKDKTEERLKFFKEVQDLYNIRSKCVHGAAIESEALNSALERSHHILCDLIEWTCEQGEVLTAQKAKELPITGAV